ncbi:MAG: sugar phosphate isomerase/epimerase [Planctomycetaceae bacterium]|jgi:sugar phosphate isomerase/epimerase|nr:sugar phosphate isomerase/epimerase [Planctomycetaceae bacterium]
MKRRQFFLQTAAVVSAGQVLAVDASCVHAAGDEATPVSGARTSYPIAVSTYSFWHFDSEKPVPVEYCIDQAAKMGFDAVEILEQQMGESAKSKRYLAVLKRQAFENGLPLCGMSTHQHFVSPDKLSRQANEDITKRSIELAATLGIPTIRVNTGRWRTTNTFDELMQNKGIEPPLAGYTDADAFPWVIESLQNIVPFAAEHGVVLGLENHWGLARTPEGLLKIVDAVNSPWLRITADTGNFLENTYGSFEKILPKAVFVQAKTYFGGGVWYSLDLDYRKIAALLRKHHYKGFVSLEFEGKESPATAVPKSLAVLRQALTLQ